MSTVGKNHYHAHSGMPGCIPNQTVVFGRLADVRDWAKGEAERWRDEEPEDSDWKLIGSAKDGYEWEPRAGRDVGMGSDHPETIWVPTARQVCSCEDVWLCDNGTWVDEPGSCWCCGEKPPGRR